MSPLGSNDAAHEMRDAFDIGEALAALAALGDPVTVYLEGQCDPLLARIDSVDDELPHFVLDFTGSKLPPAGKATLVASLGGNAKMQFELDQAWTALPDQAMHVMAEFPSSCLVLNRRAAQRLEMPVGAHYTAKFRFNGALVELVVADLSQGGVGLRGTPQQCLGLYVGQRLEGGRLELGPDRIFAVDFEIKLLRPFRTFLLGQQVQVGCAFVSISTALQEALASFAPTGSDINRKKR